MTTGLMSEIYMFVLAILVGYEVITKVPSTLHTPLMSASNAIHGIVISGFTCPVIRTPPTRSMTGVIKLMNAVPTVPVQLEAPHAMRELAAAQAS